MISDAALAELKLRNPCHEYAGKLVRLRKHGKGFIGPCPLHSKNPQATDSTSFECDAGGWKCAHCAAGGDVIKLVQLVEQVDFRAAVDRLGGVTGLDPERAAAIEAEQKAKREKAERETRIFREKERETIYEIWKRGIDIDQSGPLLRYMKDARGIRERPSGLRLRCIADMPYYESGARDAPILGRAPCMLAPIVDAEGVFRALHQTWLDLTSPNGKAQFRHSQTGDLMPAKKVRGSKTGNVIRLVEPAIASADDGAEKPTLYIGEGIETVLSAWYALHRAGRDLARAWFWSAVDLGNLAGKAAEGVPHPTLLDRAGRPQRIPGPDPDLDDKGLALPPGAARIVFLGDGDSDPFTTRCALVRAARRYAALGREIVVAWPPAGKDFNDLLRAGE